MTDRIIALIDMDCFYAQVEQRLQPDLWGKPVAVVQYSNYREGGIIAVSYEAREFGVRRNGMFADEAKTLCPEIAICHVPNGEHASKADLARYRDASAEVFSILYNFDSRVTVEKASIDEAFIDLTKMVEEIVMDEFQLEMYSCKVENFPTTHLAGDLDLQQASTSTVAYDRCETLRSWLSDVYEIRGQKLRLAVAALIIEKLRAVIREKTEFHCSAGIGPNKTLAKLVCSRHKPRQQTIIECENIPVVFRSVPIRKVRNLGGKLGKALMSEYSIETMSELAAVPIEQLSERFPGHASWIYRIAHGDDDEPVRLREKQSSVAVSKNFRGSDILNQDKDVQFWLNGLVKELLKRLLDDQLKYKRMAATLRVSCLTDSSWGKSVPITTYSVDALYSSAYAVIQGGKRPSSGECWDPPIKNISLTAMRFHEGLSIESKRITHWIRRKATQLDHEKRGRENDIDEVTIQPHASSSSHLHVNQILTNGEALRGSMMPESLEDVPADFLASLPKAIREELLCYYRRGQSKEPVCLSRISKTVSANKQVSERKRMRKKSNQKLQNKAMTDFFSKT